MAELGKVLIVLGGLLVLTGLAALFAGQMPYLGRLPGELTLQRGYVSLSVPIVTCLVVSLVLTLLLNVAARLLR